jgi:cytochrome o ubiquinol oxidase subunit 2
MGVSGGVFLATLAITRSELMMMKKVRCFLFAGLALVLSGCRIAVLDPKGVIAASQKELLIEATVLMLLIVIPVIILTFAFAWRYRAKNTKAAYRPEKSHNTVVEIICWTVPCIVIAVLATMTWKTSHSLDPFKPIDPETKPYKIQAIALNWKWLFIYPDQKIATLNFLEIPNNVPVVFFITSDGPMNSLAIPRLAGQIYAMAGMRTKLYIKATDLGEYRGFSANISGDGFSGMHFTVKVATLDEFNQWVQTVQKSPHKLTAESFAQLTLPSSNNPVGLYSLASDNLFNNLIMKYMGPDMKGMNLSD